MAKRRFTRTYIREWRRKRKLSLRRLADRMEKEAGGDPLISYASLARIEKGEQPYSQPILEALSVALGVPKALLIEVNPEKAGQVIDLVRLLDEDRQKQALEYIKFLANQ